MENEKTKNIEREGIYLDNAATVHFVQGGSVVWWFGGPGRLVKLNIWGLVR